jgi:hypothetical protein
LKPGYFFGYDTTLTFYYGGTIILYGWTSFFLRPVFVMLPLRKRLCVSVTGGSGHPGRRFEHGARGLYDSLVPLGVV